MSWRIGVIIGTERKGKKPSDTTIPNPIFMSHLDLINMDEFNVTPIAATLCNSAAPTGPTNPAIARYIPTALSPNERRKILAVIVRRALRLRRIA